MLLLLNFLFPDALAVNPETPGPPKIHILSEMSGSLSALESRASHQHLLFFAVLSMGTRAIQNYYAPGISDDLSGRAILPTMV